MKITKSKLKQIIKEELGGVLNEMGPEFPGEELPQGPGLETALQDVPPTDDEATRQASEIYQPRGWRIPNLNFNTLFYADDTICITR